MRPKRAKLVYSVVDRFLCFVGENKMKQINNILLNEKKRILVSSMSPTCRLHRWAQKAENQLFSCWT